MGSTARLEARLPRAVMARLKRAAEIRGRTVTDFVVAAADEAACRAIEETEINSPLPRRPAPDRRGDSQSAVGDGRPQESRQALPGTLRRGMTPVPFRFEALGDRHDRAAFDCGDEALDRYFRTQATQDIRRRVANCFVVVEAATGQVAGYYTLSSASIPLVDLPPEDSKRLPRYPTLPAVLIGRLAVHRRFQRRGLGELMLVDAVHRTMQDSAAAFALLVDAKNDRAVVFWERYGFRRIVGREKTLFLALATAQKTLLG